MGPPKSPPEVNLLDQVFSAGYVKDYSLAVDGGANVGDWTAKMLERFDRVYTIDASAECVTMLGKRFLGDNRVEVTHAALMSEIGRVRVISPNKKPMCQKRYVERDKEGDTRSITIDSLYLMSCGLIKLDLEGAEGQALLGAKRTVSRFRPVLVIEFYKDYFSRFGQTANDLLRLIIGEWGYKIMISNGSDRVFVNAD